VIVRLAMERFAIEKEWAGRKMFRRGPGNRFV
jgi:hypothetical protein